MAVPPCCSVRCGRTIGGDIRPRAPARTPDGGWHRRRYRSRSAAAAVRTFRGLGSPRGKANRRVGPTLKFPGGITTCSRTPPIRHGQRSQSIGPRRDHAPFLRGAGTANTRWTWLGPCPQRWTCAGLQGRSFHSRRPERGIGPASGFTAGTRCARFTRCSTGTTRPSRACADPTHREDRAQVGRVPRPSTWPQNRPDQRPAA